MKKQLLLLLLLLFSITSAFAYSFSAVNNDGVRIYYNISGDNAEVTYKDTHYNSYSGDVVIPESIEYYGTTYSLTSIGIEAFRGCSGLEKVTIPNSVTSIEGGAFADCSELTQIHLPNSVKSVGDNCFINCPKLEEIVFPSSVLTIGNGALAYCSTLSTITYGANISSIGNDIFTGVDNLKNVYSLNPAPPKVGTWACGVPSGATLHVPSSAVSAYKSASVWKKFTYIQSIDEKESNDGDDNENNNDTDDNVGYIDLGLPSGLKWAICNVGAEKPGDFGSYIAWGETTDKTYYTGYTGNWSYVDFTSLKDDSVIDDAGNLTPIYDAATVALGDSWRMPTKNELNELIENCEWEWGIQDGNNGYTVTGPNGNSIFLPCAGVPMGSSMADVNRHGFYWTSSVTENDDNKAWALYLEEETWFMDGALRGSGISIRPVLSENNPAISGDDPEIIPDEEGRYRIGNLYYFLDHDTFTASVTYSYRESTSNYANLSEVIVPESIYCNGKTYSVIEIGKYAFNRAPFTKLELPNTIMTIGFESMAVMPNLQKVIIPEGVTLLEDNAFMKSDFEEVVLPNSLVTISYGAFACMKNLTKVTIGSGTSSIGGEAFNYSSQISEILCLAEIPPTFENGRSATFTSTVYNNAILKVPACSIASYKSTSGWSNFKNIQALSESDDNNGEENQDNVNHEWIDLGLPSGLKWAICNVGAEKPGDFGSYIVWGETATKSYYTGYTGKWSYVDFSSLKADNVINEAGNLTPKYDAATVAWGDSWRMPTKNELNELIENCEWQWGIQDGNNGYTVTGPNGNSIFLPCAGVPMGSSMADVNRHGFYWASSVTENDDNGAWALYLEENTYFIDGALRGSGISIRPVLVINLVLDSTSLDLTIGATAQLSAVVSAEDTTDKIVTWTSSNTAVATVDASGKVTAIGEGEAVITASCGAASATCNVTVTRSIYNIVDGTAYTEEKGYGSIDVTYTRNFAYNIWQCLYVPFDMSYEEWSSYVKVAEFSGIHEYDDDEDGEVERLTVEYRTVKSGNIVPNVPYVIKPLSLGQISIECQDKHLVAATEAPGYIDCSTTRYTFTLRGTYEGVSGDDLVAQNAYVIGSGGLGPCANAPLAPQRFYMVMEKREGGYWGSGSDSFSMPKSIEMVVDGETTGIITLIPETEDTGIYYDLQGRRVKEPVPGIYIKDGKKIFIK